MDFYEMRGYFESESGDYVILVDPEVYEASDIIQLASQFETIGELAEHLRRTNATADSPIFLYKAQWKRFA